MHFAAMNEYYLQKSIRVVVMWAAAAIMKTLSHRLCGLPDATGCQLPFRSPSNWRVEQVHHHEAGINWPATSVSLFALNFSICETSNGQEFKVQSSEFEISSLCNALTRRTNRLATSAAVAAAARIWFGGGGSKEQQLAERPIDLYEEKESILGFLLKLVQSNIIVLNLYSKTRGQKNVMLFAFAAAAALALVRNANSNSDSESDSI